MARERPIWSARVFNTRFGRLSGPGALWECRFFNNLITPSVEKVIWLMLFAGAGRSKLVGGSGSVKTDLNWFNKMSAFAWLSE